MASAPKDQEWLKKIESLKGKDLEEAYFDAAKDGHLSCIQYMIEEKNVWPSVNDGWALKVAALYGHLDVVAYLVEKGNTWDISDDAYRSISWAAGAGHLDVVKFLIKKSGCNAHHLHNDVIREAVNNGQNHVLRYFLETGTCGDIKNMSSWLLEGIMNSDKYDTMEIILHEGIINSTRALKAAVRANNVKAVRLLTDFRTEDLDQQALKLAEELNYQEIATILKQYHDKFSRLAELEVRQKELQPMIDLLIACADIKILREALDERGKTGFIIVTEVDYLFKLLEKNKKIYPDIQLDDLTHMDRRGKSVLSMLAERQQLNRLFTSDMWLGKETDLKKLWSEIPPRYQRQVDIDAIIHRINKRVLQDKSLHRQLNLRKKPPQAKK